MASVRLDTKPEKDYSLPMKLQLISGNLNDVKTFCLVLPIFEGESLVAFGKKGVVENFLKDNPKFGKLYNTQLLYDGEQRILLVGGGEAKKFDFEKLQNLIGSATKFALNRFKEITIVVPVDGLDLEKVGEALSLGVELATHDLSREYRSEKEKIALISVNFWVEKAERSFNDGMKKGQIMADSINLVRRLGDMPSNEMTPTYFLSVARKTAKENRLTITVIDEKQAKKLGMGGFVGVAQGSEEPSYIITLEYKGAPTSKEKWGLVGKGITFDSGGISIKPSANMHEMKYDMCGAASVLGTMQILSKLKVKTNAIGVMCVTENLPGGRAQRPGDIGRLYSGKTAEVLNTDAEGRLVLVDGLTLAQKKGATKLIDLATLTGAAVVALGGVATGAMSNNPKFAQDLIASGSEVGEKIWELPMFEDYDEMIKSDIADITNIGHSGPMAGAAGAITAAKFLESSIEKEKPWVHLDIAGTAWDLKPRPFRAAGATGVGIKTLIELIAG